MSLKFHIDFRKPKRLEAHQNGLIFNGTSDTAVLLIHGLTGTPNEMAFLSSFLSKNGFSVFSPRLANHGEPIGILKNSKWQDFYGSVREAFIKIETTQKPKTIFVTGLCMGGLLALLLAHEFPDRISGVSCLAPTIFYDGWSVPWYSFFLPLAYYTPLKHFIYVKEDPPYGIKNETIRQRVHKYYSEADLNNIDSVAQYGYPYVPLTLLYQQHLLANHVTKYLSSIRVPVQLIHSKEDDTVSIKNSKFIHDRVGSEIKELITLENSYHLITVDYDRNMVAQKMNDFFSQIENRLTTERNDSMVETTVKLSKDTA